MGLLVEEAPRAGNGRAGSPKQVEGSLAERISVGKVISVTVFGTLLAFVVGAGGIFWRLAVGITSVAQALLTPCGSREGVAS